MFSNVKVDVLKPPIVFYGYSVDTHSVDTFLVEIYVRYNDGSTLVRSHR